MIPREGSRGSSFKGAGLYYLHDKEALTKERVGFTHTENLPTNDPELALKIMAATAMDAKELKRAAGIKKTGARCRNPVYTLSLSWHPEENPEPQEMIAAGQGALAVLGLKDHETLMVSHTDEAHPHIHLIVNLINPENGKVRQLGYSRKKLSEWAEEYERENGKIYCEQRVENNKRRAKKEQGVRYQDPEFEQKALITQLYHASDSGKAFQAALEAAGYKLAQGKRIVLIDRDGKMHSLSRQIEGVKAKAIREKLADLQLPEAGQIRGDQDGGSEKQKQPKREAPRQRSAEADNDQPSAPPPKRINRVQDRQLDELGAFYTESQRKRLKLNETLENQYGEHERKLMKEVSELEKTLQDKRRTWILRASGRDPTKDLENARRSLQNIEQRKTEMQRALEREINERGEFLKNQHEQERGQFQTSPPPAKENSVAKDFEEAAENDTPEQDARAAFIESFSREQGHNLDYDRE